MKPLPPLLFCISAAAVSARDEGVKFSMRNLCGKSVRIYWIGFDGALVPQSALPVKNSSGISINSYRTHKFAIWYNQATEEQTMAEALEHGTRYTVGDTNDIVTIENGLILYRHDAWHVAQEATRHGIQVCDRADYFNSLGTDVSHETTDGRAPIGFDHAVCVRGALTNWLGHRRGELDFEWDIYTVLKGGLNAYGCRNGGVDVEDPAESQPMQIGNGAADARVEARGLLDAVRASAAAASAEMLPQGSSVDIAPVCFNDALEFEIDGKTKTVDQIVAEGEDELGPGLTGRSGAASRRSTDAVIDAAMARCESLRITAQAEAREAHEELATVLSARERLIEASGSASDVKAPSWGGLAKIFGSGATKEVDAVDGDDQHGGAPFVLPNLTQAGTAYVECLGKYIGGDYSAVNREISRVRNAKGKLAEPLRNLTCNDDGVGTVGVDLDSFDWESRIGMLDNPDEPLEPPFEERSGSDSTDLSVSSSPPHDGFSGKVRRVRQLLRRNGAMVLLIDDFLSDAECDGMIDAATPGLRRSTVNEEGDNQAVSSYRNSQVGLVRCLASFQFSRLSLSTSFPAGCECHGRLEEQERSCGAYCEACLQFCERSHRLRSRCRRPRAVQRDPIPARPRVPSTLRREL